ncbi:uncharacterized protein TNCV_3038821 [Trichonephila clavipes]|nr:uncharacterized protein TNCV_3038821 [Trichonephila clavipes]
MGTAIPDVLSGSSLAMVWEDTGARSEGVACVWAAANEAVGSTCSCCMMWWSSRWLICRRHPEPGCRVNNVSSVQWFQHLHTVKSKWPTLRADHPASIIPIILPLSNSDSC